MRAWRDAADHATAPGYLHGLDARLGEAALVRFETPLLVDATLRTVVDAARDEVR